MAKAKDLLRKYNEKRDFKKTSEPRGKGINGNKKRALKFVVQEHHASRLHYDFRLELEGVLKSWAVPKGPSLDPSVKRLAMQTEDHPLDYGSFEGEIPEGEYGAGEVFLYDTGTWESELDEPEAALQKGELKFRLDGEKLKGSFVLIKTRYGKDKRDNAWLLIKHSDEYALKGKSGDVTPIAQYGSRRERPKPKTTIKGRDPWPGFIPPQLPRLVNQPPSGGGWVHEMKFDGYRIQAHIKKGKCHLFTRNGLDWTDKFSHLARALSQLPMESGIIDGEVVAIDESGKSDFQMLQNSLKAQKDSNLIFYAFDLLYLNGKDLRKEPLLERKDVLEQVTKSQSSIRVSEHLVTDAQDFWELSCEQELEGIVSKQLDSFYASGRNDLWVKTKCVSRQEFIIGGWTEPQGGRSGLGALLLGYYDKGKLRYAGRVGTGFSHVTLKELARELKSLEQSDSPFDENSPPEKNLHWVRPKKVCEVSFANWTKEGILRTPVFLGIREDKPAKDIGLERPKDVSQLREITSPEKVLFKKEEKTKQDVADFYQEIAESMLPYMANRPLSLVRCPNGSEGNCFYQKHFTGAIPDSFHTFPLEEGSGEGIYLSIDSAEGLRELVQLNAFELHAWNCHKDDPLFPDQIVMDFDPGPGVPWKEVVEAVFELKEMLDDLELKSFVKLTGGKGIHVHIPISPVYTWDQIKSFAQSLALEMVSRNPKKYVANMSKKLRTKKIFIDYLRNGYGATAVVPYSLRAKESTAIAIPLDWKELRRVKGPQEFTMDRALKKIKSRKKDPWEEMKNLEQEILILTPSRKRSQKNKKAA